MGTYITSFAKFRVVWLMNIQSLGELYIELRRHKEELGGPTRLDARRIASDVTEKT